LRKGRRKLWPFLFAHSLGLSLPHLLRQSMDHQ
jgi:hypothetical protein